MSNRIKEIEEFYKNTNIKDPDIEYLLAEIDKRDRVIDLLLDAIDYSQGNSILDEMSEILK